MTAKAGLRNPHWATSCAWGDIDGDGLLDLYVCNYCEMDLDNYPDCDRGRDQSRCSARRSCSRQRAHRLFRNNGNGTFTDVSESAGHGRRRQPAPGLGVVMTDLDGDGRLDIYVANDMRPAYLFHNQGDGRFVEKALPSGCGAWAPTAGRWPAWAWTPGDVDGSGRPSLFVTNFQDEPNVLFRNARRSCVSGRPAPQSGLGPPSMSRLGFGTAFCRRRPGRPARRGGRQRARQPERHGGVRLSLFAQQAQLFLGDGGTDGSGTRRRRRGRTSRQARSAAGWRGPTSTTTAGRTWRSATTAARRPCFATGPTRQTTGCGWN